MGALGRLPDGTPYFAPLGGIAYDPDEDRVQCHLCGRWYRVIAGSHLQRVHGWTLEEYREAFRLLKGTPTVAAGVSAALAAHTRRRVRAGELPADFTLERRARGKTAGRPVQRWRSLAVARPDLAAELHPTRNGDLDPYALATTSSRRVWWRCASCGHEWQTSVARGQGGTAAGNAPAGRGSDGGCAFAPDSRSPSCAPIWPPSFTPTRNGELTPRRWRGGQWCRSGGAVAAAATSSR